MRSAGHGGNNLERVKLPYDYGDLKPTANFGEILEETESFVLHIQPFVEELTGFDKIEQNRGRTDIGEVSEAWALAAQNAVMEVTYGIEFLELNSSVPFSDVLTCLDDIDLYPMYYLDDDNGEIGETWTLAADADLSDGVAATESILPVCSFSETCGGSELIELYDVKQYTDTGEIAEAVFLNLNGINDNVLSTENLWLSAGISLVDGVTGTEKLVLTAGVKLNETGRVLDSQGERIGYGEYGYGDYTYGGIIND